MTLKQALSKHRFAIRYAQETGSIYRFLKFIARIKPKGVSGEVQTTIVTGHGGTSPGQYSKSWDVSLDIANKWTDWEPCTVQEFNRIKGVV